ncbi:type II secretion system protein [PVC group bacterium]|nr:type II secretion system protein [PVC group bacterium]
MAKNKGFTLIELIMVIVILGILAVVAVPRFIDLREDAQEAAVDGVVGAVRAGIMIYHAEDLVNGFDRWPDDLEGDGPDSGLFEVVLDQLGLTDSSWEIDSPGSTTYTVPVGSSDRTYVYDPSTGRFSLQ